MTGRRVLRTVLVVLLVAAAGIAGWFFFLRPAASASGALTASGTVETVTVSIAPELAGKVASVAVQEGNSVKAGEVLFTLDDTLLQAQRKIAAANLDMARANSQTNLVTAQRALDDLKRSNTPRASDQLALAKAQKALTDATTNYNNVVLDPKKGGLLEAKDWLAKALARYQYLQVHHDEALSGMIQVKLARDEYLHALQAVQKAEADYASTGASGLAPAQSTVEITTGQYEVAKAAVEDAQTNYDRVKDGPNPDDLKAAQARVDSAQATLAQAQANLDLVDAQIAKLTVTAPADSIVLTRAVEPGEAVNPGSAVLTLGRLADLTITVYVPEDRVGQVALGEPAEVTVDSYPGEKFSAIVVYISDQAEFTPRNVQTVEGRQSTVFAVKLKLNDTSGRLKPGMPADVVFGQK